MLGGGVENFFFLWDLFGCFGAPDMDMLCIWMDMIYIHMGMSFVEHVYANFMLNSFILEDIHPNAEHMHCYVEHICVYVGHTRAIFITSIHM